jgi:hypothetical protein
VSPSNHLFLMRDSSGDYDLKNWHTSWYLLYRRIFFRLVLGEITANRENLFERLSVPFDFLD